MNPLGEAFEWYNVAKENHRIVVKVLEKDPSFFPGGVSYAFEPVSVAKERLLKSFQELEDLAIVSFVTVFERFIIEHVKQTIAGRSKQNADPFDNAVIDYCVKSSERWHFKEILDLYKVRVAPDLVGQAKQIYEYRNWVAHGKKDRKPLSVTPLEAYNRLFNFLEQAQILPRRTGAEV